MKSLYTVIQFIFRLIIRLYHFDSKKFAVLYVTNQLTTYISTRTISRAAVRPQILKTCVIFFEGLVNLS